MIKKQEGCACPKCNGEAVEVKCIPSEHNDAPYEVYIVCDTCGVFDPQEEED